MLNAEELRNRLSAVAVGQVAIRDFEEWLVQHSWNATSWATPEVRDAIYSIELALAEYSHGHVDASYLRAYSGHVASELAEAVRTVSPRPVGAPLSEHEITKSSIAAELLRSAA